MSIVVLEETELRKVLREELTPLQQQITSMQKIIDAYTQSKPRMNREDAARFLGMTGKQLKSLSYELGHQPLKKQTIPFQMVGAHYMYNTKDLLDYKEKLG